MRRKKENVKRMTDLKIHKQVLLISKLIFLPILDLHDIVCAHQGEAIRVDGVGTLMTISGIQLATAGESREWGPDLILKWSRRSWGCGAATRVGDSHSSKANQVGCDSKHHAFLQQG